MLSLRVTSAMILGSCLFAAGCGGAPASSDEDLESAEQEWIFVNGDDVSFFWQASTQTNLKTLAQSPLLDSNGNLVGTPLLQTAGGQRLLGYVLGCALPKGVEVKNSQYGIVYKGSGGLAKMWEIYPLDALAVQERMSACLFQSLNAFNVHVPLLLEGRDRELATAPEDAEAAENFRVSEATMFGNLFAIGKPAFACVDKDLADACGNASSAYLRMRVCGSTSECGITVLGNCAEHCTEDKSGKSYCKGSNGYSYTHFISDKLIETDFEQLYTDCPLSF